MTRSPTVMEPSVRLQRQTGFAIGLIITAVALVATLGLAIMIGSRTSYGYFWTPKSEAYAAAIIAQARNIRAGIDTMTARGTPISSITFNNAANTGLFNPSTGVAEPQVPIADALTNTSAQWVWKVDSNGNPVVKLYNVGTAGNAQYVVLLDYLTWQVCTKINYELNGQWSKPSLAAAATTTALTTPATAVDLSASNSGTQGWQAGCFQDASGNYVFISTVREQ